MLSEKGMKLDAVISIARRHEKAQLRIAHGQEF